MVDFDDETKTITREMVLMIQGLIILFSGALALMFVPAAERIYGRLASANRSSDTRKGEQNG